MLINDKYDKYNQCKSEGNEKLSIEQYLKNIRPYLHDMIDDLRTLGKEKTFLTMKLNFMP